MIPAVMSQFFPNFNGSPELQKQNSQQGDSEIYGELPSDTNDVIILGRTHQQKEEIKDDFQSRFWFTYRKNFSKIGGHGPTSDQGWGCMLRAGQMMMSETISRIRLGREFMWPKDRNQTYDQIVELFHDTHQAPASIQQIALTGDNSEKRNVGEWFGPNTMAQVMKKICFDKSLGLSVHVAMDSVISKLDIETEFQRKNKECPILLIIPLRLGLDNVNSVYIHSIQYFLRDSACVGIMGGKPNQAHYFVGYQEVGAETWLLYLDPHTTQKYDISSYDQSIHTRQMCWMKAARIDPSLAVGFVFENYEKFSFWSEGIKEQSNMPFGIVDSSSDRLVTVRSTIVSGDSDNSDYEVLDLN